MLKKQVHKLTLHQPATYEITVLGRIDSRWTEWDGEMTITVTEDEPTISTLTGTVDQAALVGVIRRLYAFGLPLISVNWIIDD